MTATPHPSRPSGGTSCAVHIGPSSSDRVQRAVADGGAAVTDLRDADAVVWLKSDPDSLPVLPPKVRWVQLPGAGVDRWLPRIQAQTQVTFTSAAGVYSQPVAEHALALLLAGIRRIGSAARTDQWLPEPVPGLEGSTVAVIGAGGIGGALIDLLTPHRVNVIAVTWSGRTVTGAERSVAASDVSTVWSAADHVVLTAPATNATRHLIGANELRIMRPHACLVNVARGSLVDTDALVLALRAGAIASAALDVVDPEPLPASHPLWREPRALITPHIATPPAPLSPHFAARVRDNVRRFAAAEPLLAAVDLDRGY